MTQYSPPYKNNSCNIKWLHVCFNPTCSFEYLFDAHVRDAGTVIATLTARHTLCVSTSTLLRRRFKMKKLLISVIAMFGVLAAMVPSAQATPATGTFNVGITLTSACAIDTSTTAATFGYTSMQATPATFSSAFKVTCTNGLPIVSVGLDSTAVTDNSTNLGYTLTLGAAPAAGTGIAQSVTLTGSMAANQSGTCATATCTNAASTNKTRTVTVTY